MKTDRNCGCMNNYPSFPGMMPGPMMPNPGMVVPNTPNYGYSDNDNYSNLSNQISNLEKRVSRLENLLNEPTKYNDSNYYMV